MRLSIFLRKLLSAGVLLALASWWACTPPPQETSAPEARQRAARSNANGPTRDLSRDEDAGGHTLRRHVGRSDEQLRGRLENERGIAAASTYTDRATAEAAVGNALQQEQDRVQRWLERTGGHPNLVLDYKGENPLGRTLHRGETTPLPCDQAKVVLRWLPPGEYYVLTSYPECR
jgi:hypothetical protein